MKKMNCLFKPQVIDKIGECNSGVFPQYFAYGGGAYPERLGDGRESYFLGDVFVNMVDNATDGKCVLVVVKRCRACGFEIFADEREKDAFCVSLQNMINEMLEDTNGYFLSYDNNTLNYLLYSVNEGNDFESTIQSHINGLKKALEKYMSIIFEDIKTDYLEGTEELKQYFPEIYELRSVKIWKGQF